MDGDGDTTATKITDSDLSEQAAGVVAGPDANGQNPNKAKSGSGSDAVSLLLLPPLDTFLIFVFRGFIQAAIAGAVVGGVLLCCAAALIVLYFGVLKNKKKDSSASTSTPTSELDVDEFDNASDQYARAPPLSQYDAPPSAAAMSSASSEYSSPPRVGV